MFSSRKSKISIGDNKENDENYHVTTIGELYKKTELSDAVTSNGDNSLSLYPESKTGKSDPTSHELHLCDVSYTVKEWVGSWWKGCCCRPRRTKEVLKDINLTLRSRQLTGILGNSGSGKTTLLEFIAGRLNGQGKIEGKVLLDGVVLDEEMFRSKGGYVIQADRLLARLTVRETLTYTARLQATGAQDTLPQIIQEKVDKIILDLGLPHVAESLVGGTLVRGISGGELRRVSIAVQMLQDPDILLLDEPTTGLDSFTAHHLVQQLSDIARKNNKIVLLSIHQPRSDIFSIFDQIGILCEGKVQYFGPRNALVPHFTSLGYPCPTYANPLDHYVDLSSVDHRDAVTELATGQRLVILRDSYLRSDIFKQTKPDLETLPALSSNSKKGKHRKKFGVTTSCKLTGILLSRMYLNLGRDPSALVARFVQLPIFALIVWIMLWRLSLDVNTAVQDRTGVFYQSLAVPSMVGVLCSSALFPSIRDLYYREAREGQYRSEHMLVAYFIHIIPFHLVSSIVFAAWVYWIVGLAHGPTQFAIYYGVVLAHEYIGELLMLGALAIFHEAAMGQAVSTLIVSFSMVWGSGLLQTSASLNFVEWLSYAIYFKWSAAVMVANEYHQLKFECEPDNALLCEAFTGDSYLDIMFPGAVENMGRNAGILASFIGIFWLLCFVLFKVRGIKQLH